MENLVLIQKGNYRLCGITKLQPDKEGNLDIIHSMKDGLAIEKQCASGDFNHYYVIAFIRYNEEREQVELEDVDFRLLDVERQEWNVVKELIKSAKDIVETQNLDRFKNIEEE